MFSICLEDSSFCFLILNELVYQTTSSTRFRSYRINGSLLGLICCVLSCLLCMHSLLSCLLCNWGNSLCLCNWVNWCLFCLFRSAHRICLALLSLIGNYGPRLQTCLVNLTKGYDEVNNGLSKCFLFYSLYGL